MTINNDIQAYYLTRKISEQYEVGKMENLIPQYLRSGIEVFSHQIYASTFALSNPFVKGFILADEAGLGKTMEALLIVSQFVYNKGKILIIVPSPTIDNWIVDLTRKFNYNIYILDNEDRSYYEHMRTRLDDYQQGIVLTTYDYILSNAEEFKQFDWNLCVMDEAHRFRSYKIKENKTADIILSIIPNAKKILLTATPIQKNEDDVFGLINFIDDNIFIDYDEFHKKYFGKPQNYPELRDLISPYTFRTLRSQVRIETKLTNREILTQIYQMTGEEEVLYNLIEKYISKPYRVAFPEMDPYELSLMLYGTLSSSADALSKTLTGIITRLNKGVESGTKDEILELQQILDISNKIHFNNKDQMLISALKQTFEEFVKRKITQKCVIFTSNTQTQTHIHKLLMEHTNYSIYDFNGTTDDSPIKKFKNDINPSILISTDKGNESLNWQEASFIINYDFPQVLLDMEQRISRCHRIGQVADVFVINFICPNNFSDVRTYELFYKRINISNNIIGASDTIISGAVEGDINQNIQDALNGVRKKKEVQIDFADLSEQFKDELEAIRTDANNLLFNTFDKSIYEKTKNMAEIIRKHVADLKTSLVSLAKYHYKDDFISENEFLFKSSWHLKNPYAKPFKYSLLDDGEKSFTISSEPCEKMISNIRYLIPKQNAIVVCSEKYRGLKGYIGLYTLSAYIGRNRIEKLIVLGIDDKNQLIASEICDEILTGDFKIEGNIEVNNDIKEQLEKCVNKEVEGVLEQLTIKHQNDAMLPISHLNMIANEKKAKLQKEILDLDRNIKALKENTLGDNFAEKFAKNQQINELTEQLFELKDNEFFEKSKINKELKAKTEEILEKFDKNQSIRCNFMLYFDVR